MPRRDDVDMVRRPDGGHTAVGFEGAGIPVVLASGAGAGRDHPFLVGLRHRLVRDGFLVASFDYPYRESRRRVPDRMPRLVECHRAVVEHVADRCGRVPFLMGKSMGGRVGSHLVVPSPGWVFLGYPLIPPGRTTPRDTSHLGEIGPLLFVQGERDALAPLASIGVVVAAHPEAALVVIAGADHGFRVPLRDGGDPERMLDELAAVTAAWMQARAA